MVRLHGQYIPVKSILLAVSETVLVFACLWVAAFIRLGDTDALRWYMAQPFAYWRLGLVAAICLTSFYYNDMYDLHVVYQRSELLIRLLESMGAASLLLAGLYYVMPRVVLGRGITAIGAFIIILTLLGWRVVVDASDFFRPVERILIAGTGMPGIRLVQEVVRHPEMRFEVVGFLDDKGGQPDLIAGRKVIGAIGDVDRVVQREGVDRVILSLSERRGAMPLKQLLRVKMAGTRIEDAHSLFEKLTGRMMLERLSPSALILSNGFRRTILIRTVKRIADLLCSCVALVIFLPLMVVIALAIYAESGSPVLFRQLRTGLNGRPFRILKFRSMRQDASRGGAAWASKSDPRITRVGAILRRCRFDEIPQFINVLCGDMSVVGPRPEQPEFVGRLEQMIPYYAERHSVRPGITGWAQISYPYGASDEDAGNKLEYDLFYVKHLTAFFDITIVIRTIQVMLFGKGAV